MIEETFAYGLVIGCSLFGILWGLVNALLVSTIHSTASCGHSTQSLTFDV
jgi:hypothetical protein